MNSNPDFYILILSGCGPFVYPDVRRVYRFHSQNLTVAISKKNTVNPIIESMTIFVDEEDYYGCIALLHKEILLKRAKPTILEYTTRELFSAIPECVQIAVCDKINNLNEMGGSVVTGIALQMRLGEHF